MKDREPGSKVRTPYLFLEAISNKGNICILGVFDNHTELLLFSCCTHTICFVLFTLCFYYTVQALVIAKTVTGKANKNRIDTTIRQP